MSIQAVSTINRILQSPMLFAKEFLKIKDKNGRLVPFAYNDLQKRRYLEIMRDHWKPYETRGGFPWYRITGARYLDLKFRQWGESTFWRSLHFHDTVANEGTDSVIYCQDASFSAKMLEKDKTFFRYLPQDLRPVVERNSSGEITFSDIESSISCGTPGASESVAEKQGRSRTIRNAHLSEFSMWPNPKVSLNALQEAIPRDGNIFIESSPGEVGDYFHLLYLSGKQDNAYWSSHFIPWFVFKEYSYKSITKEQADAVMASLTLDEQVLIKKYGLTPGQLLWRRDKIASKGGDMRLFLKEYPEDDEKCFEIAAAIVFEEILRTIRVEPREAIPGHIHTIGVDVGGGLEGSDNSTIEVIDANTRENIYWWRGHLPPNELAILVYEVWREYPGLVGIEANNMGIATVSEAYKIKDWLMPEPGFLYSNYPGHGGWLTTQATKPTYIYNLRFNLLEESKGRPGLKLGSPFVSQEMQWFQHLSKTKGGMGAPGTKGEDGIKLTDDSIIALMIANGMLEWIDQIQEIFYERFPRH